MAFCLSPFLCFKPLASYWPMPCPKPSFEIRWPDFSSLVLKLSSKKLLRAQRTPGTKNARTHWESRAPRPDKGRRECHGRPRGAKKARTLVGGKPSGAILFFLKASNSSFLYQYSQKLLDFWPMLWRQHLPCCPSFQVHTLQLLWDGLSSCTVQNKSYPGTKVLKQNIA